MATVWPVGVGTERCLDESLSLERSHAEAIIRMATQTPAASCKIDDQCGSVLPGRAADYLVLDADLKLQATYLDGKLAYQAEA